MSAKSLKPLVHAGFLGLVVACSALIPKTVHDAGKVLSVQVWGTAEKKPQPLALSTTAIQKSLAQFKVRRAEGAFSFNRGAPKALLTKAQTQALARVLAEHLPILGEKQSLVIVFHDFMTGMRYRAKVRWQTGWIRFVFDEFAVNPQLFPYPHSSSKDPKIFRAVFFPQEGQELEYTRFDGVSLRLPVDATARNEADVLLKKRALAQEAVKNHLLSPAEAATIALWMGKRRDISLDRWQRYLEKRKTLKNALHQTLFTPTEYAERLEALNKSVKPAP